MSEKHPSHLPERQPVSQAEHGHKKVENRLNEAEKLRHKHEQEESLEQARHHAEQESQSAEQIAESIAATHEQPPIQHSEIHVNRELKEIAYQRILTRARRHMRPYSRAMSHIIHQPAIDSISEVSSKTIGRPSGILGGGIVALVGTTAYYYISKHYGYNYNSFIFLTLMACGFVLGWTLEIAYKLLKALGKK
jgi:flagellar biosynthesis GTPase FlhF